jgi:hypothetical protein
MYIEISLYEIITYFLMYLSFVFYLPENGHMIGQCT